MEAVVDPNSSVSDYGFPAGAELLRFATAANRAANPLTADSVDGENLLADLDEARRRLVETLGREALVEAAGTVAAFNGLVRVADGTGIELDGGLNQASVATRSELKLNDLAGSANTRGLQVEPGSTTNGPPGGPTVAGLFSDNQG
jgi:hypothetical protein